MSGGVMPTASLSSTIIQTIDPKQKASVFTIDLTSNKGKAYQVNNGDMVIIQHRILYKGGSILLSGEVKSPGIYPIAPREKLSSVIQRAGGFTEAAYLEGSVFTRERLKKLESISINNALDQLEKDLILSQTKIKAIQATRNVAAIQGVIDKMRGTSKPMGRMAISLGKIHDDDFDVFLSHGDTLHVPTIPQEVTVIGEVNHPTSHLFDSSYDVDKYINRSGGLKKNADYSQIYVIKASGTVALASNSDKGFFRKDAQIAITRGDTIVVPLDAETATPMEVLNSVTKITSQIAITLASFKTLGIF
jgi:protein involved in polysaccharide export with SLBB domain